MFSVLEAPPSEAFVVAITATGSVIGMLLLCMVWKKISLRREASLKQSHLKHESHTRRISKRKRPGPDLEKGPEIEVRETIKQKHISKLQITPPRVSIQEVSAPPEKTVKRSPSWLQLTKNIFQREKEALPAPKPPPKDSHSRQVSHDRWSWTNTNAPSTPAFAMDRASATSARSRISAPLRMASSWIKSYTQPAKPPPSLHRHSSIFLKNQAAQPVLAPPIAVVPQNTPDSDRFPGRDELP